MTVFKSGRNPKITRSFLFLCIQMTWAAGFAQGLSLNFGTSFRRADLDVRWHVSANPIPEKAWVYKLLPRELSSGALSNLMALGPFSEKERTYSDGKAIQFETPDHSCNLWISYPSGAIRFQTQEHYSPTNLAHDVPNEQQAARLTTNLLEQIGIRISEIEKRPHSDDPNFHFYHPFTLFYTNHTAVTNIAFCGVRFRRAVAGAQVVGAGTGDGDIRFGPHGKITRVWISWRAIEAYKAYPTVPPEQIIRWIRAGKAVQGMIRMDAEPIDWNHVKSLTVTKADLCYYGGNPLHPSDWLMPFVALWTTVDRGHGKIDVEVDCPVIQDPASQDRK